VQLGVEYKRQMNGFRATSRRRGRSESGVGSGEDIEGKEVKMFLL